MFVATASDFVNWLLTSVKGWSVTVLGIVIVLALIAALISKKTLGAILILIATVVLVGFIALNWQSVSDSVNQDYDSHSGSMPPAGFVVDPPGVT